MSKQQRIDIAMKLLIIAKDCSSGDPGTGLDMNATQTLGLAYLCAMAAGLLIDKDIRDGAIADSPPIVQAAWSSIEADETGADWTMTVCGELIPVGSGWRCGKAKGHEGEHHPPMRGPNCVRPNGQACGCEVGCLFETQRKSSKS